jgi:transposase
MGRRGYPPEFRRKVLDLVEAGRPIAEVAKALGISAQSIYTWRRQDRIDKGLTPGLSSPEKEELAAARRRIAQLETELAVTRRAAELLKQATPPFDGSRPSTGNGHPRLPGAGLLPGAGGLAVRLLRLAVTVAVAAGDPPCLAD